MLKDYRLQTENKNVKMKFTICFRNHFIEETELYEKNWRVNIIVIARKYNRKKKTRKLSMAPCAVFVFKYFYNTHKQKAS